MHDDAYGIQIAWEHYVRVVLGAELVEGSPEVVARCVRLGVERLGLVGLPLALSRSPLSLRIRLCDHRATSPCVTVTLTQSQQDRKDDLRPPEFLLCLARSLSRLTDARSLQPHLGSSGPSFCRQGRHSGVLRSQPSMKPVRQPPGRGLLSNRCARGGELRFSWTFFRKLVGVVRCRLAIAVAEPRLPDLGKAAVHLEAVGDRPVSAMRGGASVIPPSDPPMGPSYRSTHARTSRSPRSDRTHGCVANASALGCRQETN